MRGESGGSLDVNWRTGVGEQTSGESFFRKKYRGLGLVLGAGTMPLVRYELRCEHSLANPELFRSAARDDPEGLLEGLAMAGLVGIVRQLGDLAEFAAEVFRDLHEEFVSVGGRAHDLTVRVQQLEAELPAVEKALLSEPNQLRFAYTNGADWHASIRSDQNHCTSGELPRFVRNFYQECRGPPRLFLLDKFDVAGAGACLKRYSDPSFFKLEWASSELMKAQRAQRDKKARREKKKGRRRKTGQPIAAINQIPARVRYSSASLDDLDSLSHLLAPTLKNEVGSSSPNQGARNESGTQPQRRSNLGPQNKVIGSPLPPTGASPARAEGEAASESVKISAKDIEANASGKFYQPTETENVVENMAGKISKIIETEDRDAIPPVELLPRNVDNKRPKGADELIRSDSDVGALSNGVAGEGLEGDVMERTGNAPRGIPSGNALTSGREGSNHGNGRVSQSSVPDVPPKESAILDAKEEVNSSELRTPSSRVPDGAGPQEDPVKASLIDARAPGQSLGKVSRRNFVDAKEAHVIAARFPKQNSERSSSGIRDLANAPAGNLLQSMANLKNLTQRSVAGHGAGEQQPKQSVTGTPAGDGSAPVPAAADRSDGSLLSASGGELHGRLLSDTKRLGNNAVDTGDVSSNPEKTVNNPTALPPIRIEEVLTNEDEPLMISSQCSSPGQDDLRPSISMLSRLSYSSELMPVSSGSEPDSPVSPNSPPFNALYSPPGSPSRILGGMVESPTGIYVSSYPRTPDRPGYSSSQSEIPVLCLSPRSKLASSSQRDHAAPLRPPPPLPIVIRIPEMPSQSDNTQEFSAMESDLPSPSLDLLTSPEADGVPSQSNGGTNHLTSARENAEVVHAEPAGGSPDNPDLLAHLEVPSERTEHIRSSAANLEAEGLSPSTTLAPAVDLRSSLPSLLDYSESAAPQPSSKSFVKLDPAQSRSVDGPASSIDDSLPTPVGEFEAYPVSEPLQGPAPSGISVQHTRVSLERALNTTPFSNSVEAEESEPSSPTGSVIIKDTPSAPGSPESNYYSESEPEVDEYRPSHGQPVSPRSITHALEDVISHRENGSGDISLREDLMFESSERRSTAAVQETGFANSVSEDLNGTARTVPEDRVEAIASHTSTQLENSHEEISLQGPSSALHSQEATTLRPIPVKTPDLKSQKSSASNSPADTPPRKSSIAAKDEEAPTLEWTGRSRPESPSKSEIRVPSGRSASNSPPTSPPKFLDQASSLRWRGRSDPASFQPNFSLPPNLVCRSETSSPPCSPPPPSDLESPKQWDEVSEVSTSSDSSERSAEEAVNVEVYRFPDSRLPPDSPAMSEEGDGLSNRASDEEDDRLSQGAPGEEGDRLSKRASDDDADRLTKRASDEEADRLSKRESDEEDDHLSKRAPDEEDNHLSKRASDEEGDRSANRESDEEDVATHQEQEMAEPATERSGSQLPSEKLSSEALSSATDGSYDGHPPSDTVSKSSTIENTTESISSDTQVASRQPSNLVSQTNTNEAHEAPPLPPLPGSTDTPPDALAAAKAHHDWNMMKAMSFQDPDHRQYSPPGGRPVLHEEVERKDPIIRPSASINVAAILEKANAIRQAFVGSDDEGDDEDDWSDS